MFTILEIPMNELLQSIQVSLFIKNTNWNCVSKSNPILHCFLITFSVHQKKNRYQYQLCWLTVIFNVFFFNPSGFSFGYHPMLTSSSTKSIVTDNSLKRSDRKKGSSFFMILIRFYNFKTFLIPCTFLMQYFDSVRTTRSSYIYICTYIFTNPSAGCDKRSFFKQSLTGLNSEFSFLSTGCHAKTKEFSLSYYLFITRGRIVGFILFPRVFALFEIQTASSRIRTWVSVFISNNDNHYSTGLHDKNFSSKLI